jgi:hypothetical protein
MKMTYGKMTRLACYVASEHTGDYEKGDIEDLVREVGKEVAHDFYVMLERNFGTDVDDILNWIEECEEE